jgi:hypothetical protein
MYFEGTSHGAFGYETTPNAFVVITPHWVIVLFSGLLALALAPEWLLGLVNAMRTTVNRIHISRRFSLGALFIATTLVAAILGLIVLSK